MLPNDVPPSNSAQFLSLLRQALKQNPLLQQLSTAVFDRLQAAMQLVWVKEGETVMRQGEASNTLAIVVLGRVQVIQKNEAEETTIVLTLGHGQTVGEMGLLTGEPRTADVIATRDSLLATLSRQAFHQLLEAHPQEMNQHFVRPIIQRLQAQLKGKQQFNASVRSMVLLPAHEGVDLHRIADALQAKMQPLGKTLVLDKRFIETHFGQMKDEDQEEERRLTLWLGELESTHQLMLYLDRGQDEAWTRRCLQQADKIVLVGDTAVSPLPPSASQIIALQQPEAANLDRYLVLIQPDTLDMPRGTAAWLDALNVRHHYHLRLGQSADIARVARLLAEQGLGLVLSGASVRGFAHIGVMGALRDAGIPIDIVAGASSGAMATVCLATQWSQAKIVHIAGKGPRFQYTLPLSALTTGFGQLQWLQAGFGDLQVEDCWLPNFFPILNLTKYALEIVDRGPVAELLRAATALPGLAPPLLKGSDILVDSGLADYVPVTLMRDRPDVRQMIAVYVLTTLVGKTKRRTYLYDGVISGWRLLRNQLNPFVKKIRYPALSDILLRSMLVEGIQKDRQTRDVADEVIHLDLSGFDIFDLSRIPELISKGYQDASAEIKEKALEKKFGPTS